MRPHLLGDRLNTSRNNSEVAKCQYSIVLFHRARQSNSDPNRTTAGGRFAARWFLRMYSPFVTEWVLLLQQPNSFELNSTQVLMLGGMSRIPALGKNVRGWQVWGNSSDCAQLASLFGTECIRQTDCASPIRLT